MKHCILTLLAGSASIFGVAQSGNVGIGTTAPIVKLQIHHTNTLASPAVTLFDSTAGSGSRIRFAKQNIKGSKVSD